MLGQLYNNMLHFCFHISQSFSIEYSYVCDAGMANLAIFKLSALGSMYRALFIFIKYIKTHNQFKLISTEQIERHYHFYSIVV